MFERCGALVPYLTFPLNYKKNDFNKSNFGQGELPARNYFALILNYLSDSMVVPDSATIRRMKS
jgi:hypothetical protein